MFISGGENISPEEIETALMEKPGVEQALVVPVIDEEYGRRPAAFIKWSHAAEQDQNRLRHALEGRLARYKIPDFWLPWPEKPPLRGGKLDRAGFREQAERLIIENGMR